MMLSIAGAHSKEVAPVTSFHYRYVIAMSMYGGKEYHVKTTNDGKVFVTIDKEYPLSATVEVDKSILDDLQQIVEKYNMHKYKDHYLPPVEVLDGSMWSMGIGFADGDYVSSSGSNAWPDNGHEAFGAVSALLDVYRIRMWEGHYASCPEDYREWDEHEDSYFDNSLYTMTVGPAQADSSCDVTITAKGKFTLRCEGKIKRDNDMAIYLRDVKNGMLPSGKPFDWSKPIFVISKYMRLEDCQELGLFDEHNYQRFAKLKK